ncbi:MAG TPA: LacI family DNA-binding transcriptional regulator [Terriglobales bacterium]|nr:LacI family DNA-binding transcriptional regulator [Terriglobales bacterium]
MGEVKKQPKKQAVLKKGNRVQGAVTLKTLSAHVGLSLGTISALLNDSPSSKHIPEKTRERVLAAARELEYRPNFFARSLRNKRTYTIGVMAHEIGDAYSSIVISGIEKLAREKNYFFITGIHRHDPGLFDRYSKLLLQRGAEGMITVDYNLQHSLPVPTIAIAGHPHFEGVTNIILDHERAAFIALKHLVELGHRKIAFMRGHPASSDSKDRWLAICRTAQTMGVEIDPSLTIQFEMQESTPKVGYIYAKQLIADGLRFSALFAYNDVSALGAMRAFQEAGYHVPRDISIIGFDDIAWAEYQYPSLTTVRQPLQHMGEIALHALLERLERREAYPPEIAIEPELIVRESTAKAASTSITTLQK